MNSQKSSNSTPGRNDPAPSYQRRSSAPELGRAPSPPTAITQPIIATIRAVTVASDVLVAAGKASPALIAAATPPPLPLATNSGANDANSGAGVDMMDWGSDTDESDGEGENEASGDDLNRGFCDESTSTAPAPPFPIPAAQSSQQPPVAEDLSFRGVVLRLLSQPVMQLGSVGGPLGGCGGGSGGLADAELPERTRSAKRTRWVQCPQPKQKKQRQPATLAPAPPPPTATTSVTTSAGTVAPSPRPPLKASRRIVSLNGQPSPWVVGNEPIEVDDAEPKLPAAKRLKVTHDEATRTGQQSAAPAVPKIQVTPAAAPPPSQPPVDVNHHRRHHFHYGIGAHDLHATMAGRIELFDRDWTYAIARHAEFEATAPFAGVLRSFVHCGTASPKQEWVLDREVLRQRLGRLPNPMRYQLPTIDHLRKALEYKGCVNGGSDPFYLTRFSIEWRTTPICNSYSDWIVAFIINESIQARLAYLPGMPSFDDIFWHRLCGVMGIADPASYMTEEAAKKSH